MELKTSVMEETRNKIMELMSMVDRKISNLSL